MARIHQHLHYSDTRAELVEHKDARRGACEDAFWDETELVDHRTSRAKRKARKKRGCPGNDYGKHVWIWADWHYLDIKDYEELVCCGCEKRKRGSGTFRKKQ